MNFKLILEIKHPALLRALFTWLLFSLAFSYFFVNQINPDFNLVFRRIELSEERFKEIFSEGFLFSYDEYEEPIVIFNNRLGIIKLNNIPEEGAKLLIKISPKILCSNPFKLKILANGKDLNTLEIKEEREYFINIPHEVIQKGENSITFVNTSEPLVPLNIQYLKLSNVKGFSTGVLPGYMVDDFIQIKPQKFSPLIFLIILFYTIILGISYSSVLCFLFNTPITKAISLSKYIYLLNFFILSSFSFFNHFSDYKIVYPSRSFFVMSFFLIFINSIILHLILNIPDVYLKLKNTVLKIINLLAYFFSFITLKTIRLLAHLFSFVRKKLIPFIIKKITLFGKLALNSKLTPYIFALLICISLIFLHLPKFNWDITGFLYIGDQFIKDFSRINEDIYIHKNSPGYDGQFFYYISLDPFLISKDYIENIDNPPYRYGRIGYPLLAYFFSFGQKKIVPYLLFFINIFALLGCIYFLLKFLKFFNIPNSIAIIFTLFPGFFAPITRCLAEPLNIFFLMVALFFYLSNKYVLSVILATFAVLTRETSITVVFSIILYFVLKKHFKKAMMFFIPIISYFLWQIYLFLNFKNFSFLSGNKLIDSPFAGIIKTSKMLKNFSFPFNTLEYKFIYSFYLLLLMIAFILSIKYLIQDKNPFSFSFFFYITSYFFLSENIWAQFSYMRVTSEGIIFFLINSIINRDRNYLMLLIIFLFLLFLQLKMNALVI
ncbi:MAG: AZOBR_p60025 family cell surface glycopolymer formation protein [Acidobacteriota bacterium]